MIDDVYNVILTVLTKEQAGYLTPAQFDLLGKQVQLEIFRGYFEDITLDKRRQGRALTSPGASDLVHNQRERIDMFAKTSGALAQTGGVYTLPTDLYHIEDNGVQLSTGKVAEYVNRGQIRYIQSSSTAAPSETYPIYELTGNTTLTIYPSSYTDTITVRYIREPLDPKWTYSNSGGNPLYNAAAGDHQDFELHPSEFTNIVLRMLFYQGINLREPEVVQIIEDQKVKGYQKENA